MTEWSFDRWIAIIGSALAVLAFWFAIYAYRKQGHPKVLAYLTTEPIPFLLPIEGLSALYHGKELRGLSRVFVLIWNRGSTPIEQEDFVTPIEIKNGAAIVKFDIKEKDSAADVRIDLENHALCIGLLRPNEAVVLQIDAGEEAYKPDLVVNMKSADMSQKLGVTLQFLPLMMGLLSGALAELAALYQADDLLRYGDYLFGRSSVFAGILFFSVLLIAPIFVGSAFAGIAVLYMRIRIPAVVRRFFALHVGTMPVPNSWKTIRRSLDAAKAP
jgi:hypothetical protein